MQLPFTTEQFFAVFRDYNTSVWPAQLVLLALAVVALGIIWHRPKWGGAAVSIILSLLWAWMAIGYHLVFFAEINPLAYVFAAVSFAGAILFFWFGVVRREISFSFGGDPRSFAGLALILFALVIYPMWVSASGHGFPELPTFGLPCPTTIYTIGLLAFSTGRGTRWVAIVPFLWSLVGTQAAFLLDVRPDLGLGVAGLVALVLIIAPGRE